MTTKEQSLERLIERVKAAAGEQNFSDAPDDIRQAVRDAISAWVTHDTYSQNRAMLAAVIAFLTALKDASE